MNKIALAILELGALLGIALISFKAPWPEIIVYMKSLSWLFILNCIAYFLIALKMSTLYLILRNYIPCSLEGKAFSVLSTVLGVWPLILCILTVKIKCAVGMLLISLVFSLLWIGVVFEIIDEWEKRK